MAQYQARYINHSIEAAIDRAIEKLNPSQFATKQDIMKLENDILRLETSTKNDILRLESSTKNDIMKLELSTKTEIMRLETKINDVEYRLNEKITAVDSKLLKHTVFILITMVLTTVPDSIKHSMWSLLHI